MKPDRTISNIFRGDFSTFRTARPTFGAMDRIRAGLTGLAAVFLITAVAALLFAPDPAQQARIEAAQAADPGEPLAQLGVAPGSEKSNPPPPPPEVQPPLAPSSTPSGTSGGAYSQTPGTRPADRNGTVEI